jgi:D-alanyl-D-alanine carboxypeptidase (penicillin-binding protein 5/6)
LRTSSIVAIIVAVIVALGIVQVVRPVAKPVLAISVKPTQTIAGASPKLPWPAGAQADAEVQGVGVWAQHGPSAALPIGSLAKMMTAYLVLKAHPLSVAQNGPSLTVTPADVTLYQQDATSHQSVMYVQNGEKLSELFMLEGILVPSGNNIATMLGDWVGGTVTHFAQQMNQTAHALGMTHTHYNGPVGLQSTTVSTAADQMKLAAVMMKNPVFQGIVAMPQLAVPGQSALEYNYNFLVGHKGVIGVKTGSTVQAGGCVVLAKNVTVGNRTLTVYSSVLGVITHANQLQAALNDADSLLNAAGSVVSNHRVVTAGQTVGSIKAPWQNAIPLVATKSASFLGWPGLHYTVTVNAHLPSSTNVPKGTVVGTLTATMGSQTVKIPVKTGASLIPPTLNWRLRR